MKQLAFFLSAFSLVASLSVTGCKINIDGVSGGPDESGGGGAPVDPVPTEPTIVATGKAGTLAVDDEWLYIGDTEPVPFRVEKSGGVPTPIGPIGAISETADVTLIALDDTHVYWVTYDGIGSGSVWRAPKTGNAPPTLLSNKPGPNNASPAAIAVDDQFVYVTMPDIYNGNVTPDQLDGVVRRIPKAGGPHEDLATVYSYGVAADADYVYWTRVALDNSGELIRANKDGSNPVVFQKELGRLDVVLTAGNRLFWTYQDVGIYSLRTWASGAASTVATSDTYLGAPAVASDAAYWLRSGDASMGAVLRGTVGGDVSELVNAPAAANAPVFYGTYGTRVAVDDAAVYWSYEPYDVQTGGAPRVYRVAR